MKGLTYKIEKSLREKKIEIDELNTTIWKVKVEEEMSTAAIISNNCT